MVIFNVSQHNVERCLKECQTALRSKNPPFYLREGQLCFLRKTSRIQRGPDVKTKDYGVVGVYRMVKIEKHDPNKSVVGWVPEDGWTFMVKLEEIFVLPSVFNEEFSIPTEIPGHKESKYMKGLFNKNLQHSSILIEEPTASNYIEAIEDNYPQLVMIIAESAH